EVLVLLEVRRRTGVPRVSGSERQAVDADGEPNVGVVLVPVLDEATRAPFGPVIAEVAPQAARQRQTEVLRLEQIDLQFHRRLQIERVGLLDDASEEVVRRVSNRKIKREPR